MPTRRNPYQRDPALAEAFDNLSQLFAPPSGSDLAGYATAASRRADMERRNWLFNNSADPSASARSSLVGIQNYSQTPSGFNKTDATNRRGQDITAATSLATNRADNARAVTQSMLAPVGQGATRFVPPSIAEMYGVPGTQIGVVETKPGERSVLPGGQVLDGPAKPLSSDEVLAGVIQGGLQRGEVTPRQLIGPKLGTPVEAQGPNGRVFATPGDAMLGGMQPVEKPLSLEEAKAREFARMPGNMQQAIVFGSTPIEQVIVDGKPTNVTRPGALGQTPVPPAGQTPKIFVDANGIPLLQDADGSLRYTDGRPMPPGTKLFNLPTPFGSQEQVGMGTTANRTRAQAIRGTVANADRLMADIDQTIRENPASAGVAANLISFSQDIGQVFREFGEKFGAANSPVSTQDLFALTQRVAPGDYNPVYRRVRAQLLELAYTNARLNNPSGEVSRFALEREIEALGLGGMAGNDQAVLAVLDAARSRLRRSLSEADVLEGTAQPPTADTLYRPQSSKPAPQAGAPAAPAGRARIISSEPIQ